MAGRWPGRIHPDRSADAVLLASVDPTFVVSRAERSGDSDKAAFTSGTRARSRFASPARPRS